MDYQAVPENPEDIRVKRLLDEIYMVDPCLGNRRLVTDLKRDNGVEINRKRLQRLRREIGHEAIRCKPRTSIPDNGHRKYPYLPRDLTVARPDQAWCTDITYVPMPGGRAYLCAVMDWYSRKVLGWAVSTPWKPACAWKLWTTPWPARSRSGNLQHRPGLPVHLRRMDREIARSRDKISMDGRGRWMDNVFTRAAVEERETLEDLSV